MIKKVAAVAAAAGGLVLAGAGVASADQGVSGFATESPGFASGNEVHGLLNAPVNVCGNTVSVAGQMNPATGSVCTGR